MPGMLIFIQTDTHDELVSSLDKLVEETKMGRTLYGYMEATPSTIIEVDSLLEKYDSMSSCLKLIAMESSPVKETDDKDAIYLRGKEWGRARYALSYAEFHKQLNQILPDIPKHKILFSEGASSGRQFELDQRNLKYL